MITCGKIALKPKSVDSDAKSIIRDLCVLKDARTAPRTGRKTVPRHPSTCIAKEHSSMLTKIFSGGMQLAHWKKNRPGLQAPKQKLLQKQAPKKGCRKWTLKRGPPYLSEPWGPQMGVPKLLSKLGTKPTQPDQFHAFSCNTWIGKEAVTGKVPMRPFKLSENVSNMSVGMEGHHGKANTGGSLQPLEGRPEQRAKPVLLAAALWGPLHTRHFETWPNHEAGIV